MAENKDKPGNLEKTEGGSIQVDNNVSGDLDEWRSLIGMRYELGEPCALSYDEYGNITFMGGVPTLEFYNETKKKADEYAEVCSKSRMKIFEAEAKYLQATTKPKYEFNYVAFATLLLALMALVIISN